MDKLIKKADVLIEALPYIQKFQGSIVVVKFGGSAMEDPVLIEKAMRDIVLLNALGMKIVVIHGGGKAISAKLKEMGLGTQFINGLRVTDEATIGVVDDVLHNNNNRTLVEDICKAGGKAVSISGKKIMRAEKLYSTDKETGEKLDIGFADHCLCGWILWLSGAGSGKNGYESTENRDKHRTRGSVCAGSQERTAPGRDSYGQRGRRCDGVCCCGECQHRKRKYDSRFFLPGNRK